MPGTLDREILRSDQVESMVSASADMSREKLIECFKRLALSHERLHATYEVEAA